MIYMLLAEGFEETEAIGALDVMRRAGLKVQTVGITGKYVCGSHGVEVTADIEKNEMDFDEIDGVVLPGGMPGTENLKSDSTAIRAVKLCAERGLLTAAICAAPMILGQLGLLKGKRATCYPGYEKELDGAECCTDSVSVDGNIITARGAGVSMLFGARIADFFEKGSGEEILIQMQHA